MSPQPYRVETNKTAQTTLTDIRHCVEIWNRDSGAKVISDYDILPSMKVAGVDATVRLELRNSPLEIRCSSQSDYALNLRCCYLALDSMRLNERRGIGDVLREAYAQLPAAPRALDPYEVLGVRSDTPLEDIEAVYRSKARRAHPDAGGSDAQMKELNEAIKKIRDQRNA